MADRGQGEHYIRGTFTRNNLDFLEDVRALVEEGFRQISLEPVVLPDDSPYSILKEHLPRVFAEYDALAGYYLQQRRSGHWFNFFHFMIDMEGGPCLPQADFRLRRRHGVCRRNAGGRHLSVPSVCRIAGMEAGQRVRRHF